jgi:putative membrane protein
MPLHAAIFAFLHHIAAFGLVAMLVAQLILLRTEINVATANRLQTIDMLVGAFAGTLFVIGLLRVFYFEKGSEYYFANGFFLIKFALFLLTGLLSIMPTLEILSWRKAIRAGQTPAFDAAKIKRLRMVVHLELGAIVIILLCAALMARSFEL